MKNRRCCGATLLAGSIFLCYSGFAYSQVGKVHPAISSAALGIRWGELRIHPAFSLTEQYESNVFQTPTNEQGDFSTRISPGFALHLPLSRHDFFGGYRAEFVKYGSLKNQDTVNHFATLGMKLDFPGGLLVNMDNVFSEEHRSTPFRRDRTGQESSGCPANQRRVPAG